MQVAVVLFRPQIELLERDTDVAPQRAATPACRHPGIELPRTSTLASKHMWTCVAPATSLFTSTPISYELKPPEYPVRFIHLHESRKCIRRTLIIHQLLNHTQSSFESQQ